MTIIEPKTLKGFRDYLPEQMAARNTLIRRAQEVFSRYAFMPIGTPALEYSEVLLGKGGGETEKQVFRFCDQGGRDVSLRYDLTVPLARFAAAQIGSFGTPFRAFQIGPVWRGEKPQKGRYREFVQCDFDLLGDITSNSESEILLVAHEILTELGVTGSTIHINSRSLISAFLEQLGIATDLAGNAMRILDKLPKIGPEAVGDMLREECALDALCVERLLKFAQVKGDAAPVRLQLQELGLSSKSMEHFDLLEETYNLVRASGVGSERLIIDCSISRGLDYYTGLVFETFLSGPDRSVGSICSGGRYENLTSLFSKQPLPGVGGSVGVDRLLSTSVLSGLAGRVCTVFLPFLPERQAAEQVALAARLRAAGVRVDAFPDNNKKLGVQFRYAEKRGYRFAITATKQEGYLVKDLSTGDTRELNIEDVAALHL